MAVAEDAVDPEIGAEVHVVVALHPGEVAGHGVAKGSGGAVAGFRTAEGAEGADADVGNGRLVFGEEGGEGWRETKRGEVEALADAPFGEFLRSDAVAELHDEAGVEHVHFV